MPVVTTMGQGAFVGQILTTRERERKENWGNSFMLDCSSGPSSSYFPFLSFSLQNWAHLSVELAWLLAGQSSSSSFNDNVDNFFSFLFFFSLQSRAHLSVEPGCSLVREPHCRAFVQETARRERSWRKEKRQQRLKLMRQHRVKVASRHKPVKFVCSWFVFVLF